MRPILTTHHAVRVHGGALRVHGPGAASMGLHVRPPVAARRAVGVPYSSGAEGGVPGPAAVAASSGGGDARAAKRAPPAGEEAPVAAGGAEGAAQAKVPTASAAPPEPPSPQSSVEQAVGAAEQATIVALDVAGAVQDLSTTVVEGVAADAAAAVEDTADDVAAAVEGLAASAEGAVEEVPAAAGDAEGAPQTEAKLASAAPPEPPSPQSSDEQAVDAAQQAAGVALDVAGALQDLATTVVEGVAADAAAAAEDTADDVAAAVEGLAAAVEGLGAGAAGDVADDVEAAAEGLAETARTAAAADATQEDADGAVTGHEAPVAAAAAHKGAAGEAEGVTGEAAPVAAGAAHKGAAGEAEGVAGEAAPVAVAAAAAPAPAAAAVHEAAPSKPQPAPTPAPAPPPARPPLPRPPMGVRVCYVLPGTASPSDIPQPSSDNSNTNGSGSTAAANSKPFLLQLPDLDGVGLTSRRAWPALSERFDMRTLQLSPQHAGSFDELAFYVASYLDAALAGAPPERPVYLMGEGFGAVLALAVAMECPATVDRLLLVNPSTSYPGSPLARAAPALSRLPPAVAAAGLPWALAPALIASWDPFVAAAEVSGTGAERNRPSRGAALDGGMAGGSGDDERRAARRDAAGRLVSSALSAGMGLLRRSPSKVLSEGQEAARATLARIQELSTALPADALPARLLMLTDGCTRVEPRLGVVGQRTMLLAGGRDLVAGSQDEARRLRGQLQRAFVRVLPDSGHAPLSEPGVDLISLMDEEGFMIDCREFTSTPKRGRRGLGAPGSAGPIEKPGAAETARASADWNGTVAKFCSPVFFSTMPDGTIVRGLAGIPADERPLLFVGNHQLFALDMTVLAEGVLKETGVLMRGLAHPSLFTTALDGSELDKSGEGGGEADAGSDSDEKGGSRFPGLPKLDIPTPPPAMQNMYRTFGAVQVTPSAFYRLMAQKEAVLLYPGGVREGFKRKGEQYELFWPSKPEFVRMAARFEATIVPVAAVGIDDSVALVLDSDEIAANPFLRELGWGDVAKSTRAARVGISADPDNDQTFVPPIIAPQVPARLYFLFGQPLKLDKSLYDDRNAAAAAYADVRARLEGGIGYLLRKREQDPYKDFLPRYLYENPPLGKKEESKQADTFAP
ncbi:hypothetical protein FOA52_010304 [Chlamydomonas sp. UWO 241]|nr:hypothetical protein FOA52_010304 [Chlamydomonas sp. UWO 241]